MFGYVYITQNLINKKQYIGQKKSSCFLGNKYLGSGIILKKAIQKYGRENFYTNMLDTAETQEELNDKEKFWINFYKATENDNFYNIAVGGEGGNVVKGYSEERMKQYKKTLSLSLTSRELSEEHKKNISKSKKNTKLTKKHKEKLSKIFLNRDFSKETRKKNAQSNIGKIVSEDTKQKIRKGQEKKHCGDRLYINNGKECKHIRAHNFPFYQSQGWEIGRLRKGEKKDAD